VTATPRFLEVVSDTEEIRIDEEPLRTRTPVPQDDRPLVAEEKGPGDPTMPYAPRNKYEEGVEDAIKFMRASLIWRTGQRITRNLAEEVYMDVRLAARDTTPRSSK
jgi:hypothetical protein